jgi:hypothetical protein
MELASICRRTHTGFEGTAILSRSRERDRGFESVPSSGESARTLRSPPVLGFHRRRTEGSNPPPSSGESTANFNLGRRSPG